MKLARTDNEIKIIDNHTCIIYTTYNGHTLLSPPTSPSPKKRKTKKEKKTGKRKCEIRKKKNE